MKKIFLMLSLSVAIIGCKKKEVTPTQPPVLTNSCEVSNTGTLSVVNNTQITYSIYFGTDFKGVVKPTEIVKIDVVSVSRDEVKLYSSGSYTENRTEKIKINQCENTNLVIQ